MPPEQKIRLSERQLALWREHQAKKLKEGVLHFLGLQEPEQQDYLRGLSVEDVRALLDAIVKVADRVPNLTIPATVLNDLLIIVDPDNHKETRQDADDRYALRPEALAKVREESRLQFGSSREARAAHARQLLADRDDVKAAIAEIKAREKKEGPGRKYHLMAADPAIAQLSVPVRREHNAKVATLRDELETALRGLQAQEEEETARAKVKRCRLSMLEVGRILAWVVKTGSWSEDGTNRNFADFYRREGMNKNQAERLIRYSEAHDGVDAEVMAKAFPDGMSTRTARTVNKIPTEERNEVVREVSKSTNPSAALSALTQSLRMAPVATVNEGEARKQVKPDTNFSWIRRALTSLGNKFEGIGLGDEAAPSIEKLLALAEGHYAQKV